MHPGPIIERTRNFRLTGNVKHRLVKAGLFFPETFVALQVEEQFDRAVYSAPPRNEDDLPWTVRTSWRDATPLDLASPALRWLVDGVALTQVKD